MPSKIDRNLIPPVIRESVDPDILNRAQSIEWSINRDTGEDEHGYLDGSSEDYLNPKRAPLPPVAPQRKSRKIEWFDQNNGRDSGFDQYTPTSPSLGQSDSLGKQHGSSLRSISSLSAHNDQQHINMSPMNNNNYNTNPLPAGMNTNTTGSMKRHPKVAGQYPFPIYKVNQEQLVGDVVFEVAPRAKPGERTVHYEKSSRILNEEQLNALGLDQKFFTPNSRTTMDEQEEEMVETSVLNGDKRELEELYQSMRADPSGYFDRQRARSVSPSNRNPIETEQSSLKKTVLFGSVDEINNREQEFYPYRDAHQGKPLPGENEYGTWGSRFDDKRQWKLCNGQWVRVAEPKPEPKYEKYMAERVKCKPPKKEIAKTEPVRQTQPQSGSTDDSDSDDLDLDSSIRPQEQLEPEPALDDSDRGRSSSLEPESRIRKRRPLLEEPVDIDALRDKYRPKVKAEKVPNDGLDTKPYSKPAGTILLEPIRPPTPPLEEIKVEPVQPTYVEMKKPLKRPEGEEEKMMEDPNLMWMRMGPAQYGPPFGSLRRRKAREEEWIGPPCELCHKQIEERRCMLAENMKFHCWHFACSFCLKTLKPADFLIAEADRKCYCLNCHKREFPEISLANLNLAE